MWIATAVGQQLTHFVDCAKQDGAVVVERHRGRKAPFSIIKPAFPCSLTCRGCLGQVEEQRVLRDPWLSLHPGHSKSAHRGWCVDVAPPGAKGRGGREGGSAQAWSAGGRPARAALGSPRCPAAAFTRRTAVETQAKGSVLPV